MSGCAFLNIIVSPPSVCWAIVYLLRLSYICFAVFLLHILLPLSEYCPLVPATFFILFFFFSWLLSGVRCHNYTAGP